MDDATTSAPTQTGAEGTELWTIDQVMEYLKANTTSAARYVLAQLGVEAAAYRRPSGTGQPRAFYDAEQIRLAVDNAAKEERAKPSPVGSRICTSPDCTRDAQPSREWCGGHYGRLSRHGDLLLGVPFQRHGTHTIPTGCVTAACTEQARDGTLYCAVHDVYPERSVTCAVHECDGKVFSTGLCSRHFQSWWRRGHNRNRYRARTGNCAGRCPVCQWDHAREVREDRLAALEQGPLNAQARRNIVRRVWSGEPLEEAIGETGLSVRQIWSTGTAWPEFLYALDAGLMARRDTSISHESPYSYRVHRCRCPQCREAKARNR